MTVPIWFASPPELHSALLAAGPGPGPLLATAQAYDALAIELSTAAIDLGALLASAGASWTGPSAGRFTVAMTSYLEWLVRASADSALAARQVYAAAAGYTAALGQMPTLAELAANHAANAALLATNFLGVNTIPIALNEADYARMWMQAAIAMSEYQAVASLAVASMPAPDAPPVVLSTPAGTAARLAAARVGDGGLDGIGRGLADLLDQILRTLRTFFDTAERWLEFLRQLAAAAAPLAGFVAYETGQFFTTLFLTNILPASPFLLLLLPLVLAPAVTVAPASPPAPLTPTAPPARTPSIASRPHPAPSAAPPLGGPGTTTTGTTSAGPTAGSSAAPAPSGPPALAYAATMAPANPPENPPPTPQRPASTVEATETGELPAAASSAHEAGARGRRRRRAGLTRTNEHRETPRIVASMGGDADAPPRGEVPPQTTRPTGPSVRARGLIDPESLTGARGMRPLLPQDEGLSERDAPD